MDLKKIALAALMLPLMTSAFSASANIEKMYIIGPEYIEHGDWDAKYSLQGTEGYNNEVHWLLAEDRYDRTKFLKTDGNTAITGFGSGWLPRTSLLQAVVLDNGMYTAINKKFCQKGSVLDCNPLKSELSYRKGEQVNVDFKFAPKDESKKKNISTQWYFDSATARLLKDNNVEVNKGKFSLSFTAPDLPESTKITIQNHVTTPTNINGARLIRDICLVGADQAPCKGMDNTFNVANASTLYDFYGFNENMGRFEKGDRILDKGVIYSCVSEDKCNLQEFTPVNGTTKWRAAWVRTYL